MAKKNLSNWSGPGFINDRGTTPLPHMGGPKGVGAEGPKRLSPLPSYAKSPAASKNPVYAKSPAASKKPGTEGPKQSMPLYRDKYGRRMSKEEYEKREMYRKRRKKQTADQSERERLSEMKRRKKYRKGPGTAAYGSGATTKTRNQDLALGVSSRYVNKKPKGDRSKYQK